MVGREKKESVKIEDIFFALNFWLSLTSALQQSRILLSKILDPPLCTFSIWNYASRDDFMSVSGSNS